MQPSEEPYRLLFDLTKTNSWQPFFTKSYPRPALLSNQVLSLLWFFVLNMMYCTYSLLIFPSLPLSSLAIFVHLWTIQCSKVRCISIILQIVKFANLRPPLTIGIAILIKNNKKLCSYIRAIVTLIVIIISTRVVFLRVWRQLLQFSTKTWNKEN